MGTDSGNASDRGSARPTDTEPSSRRAGQFLEAVIQSSQLAIIVLDSVGHVAGCWNPAAERIFGWKAEEVQGRPAPMVQEDRQQEFMASLERVFRGETIRGYETQRLRKDGTLVDVRLSAAPLKDADGKPLGAMGLIEDITDRVRAEKALRQAKGTLDAVIDASPLAIFVMDRDGYVIHCWNPAAERIFGWKAEEVLGRRISVVDERHHHEFLSIRRRALDGETILGYETQRCRKDGSLIDVRVSVAPMADAEGRIIGTMGLIEDITQRKAAEREVQRLASFPQLNPFPIAEVALDGCVRYVNPAAARLFPDLEKRGFEHPFMMGVKHRMARILEAPHQVMMLEVPAAGAYYAQSVFVTPTGDAIRVYGLDITERRRMEEALRDSEADYRAVVEDMPALICRFLPSGILTFVNGAYSRYFGKTRQELIGRNFFEFIPPKEHAGVRARYLALTGQNPTVTYKHRVVMPDGSIRWQQRTDRALLDEGGNVIGYQSIGQDITERRQARRRLAAYQRRLRSLASELVLSEERERRRLSVFLHDQIGQALAMAKMRLQAWTAADTPGDARQVASEVQEIIEQVIGDTRSMTFDLSPPILYELGFAAAVEWLLERLADKEGLRFEFVNDAEPKLLAEDVRVALFLAVRELLMNVIKHARAKGVNVSIQQTDDELTVQIVDDGRGFEAEKVAAPGSRAGGFGLFNIREHLGHLGGRFDIASAPGQGTKATLAVPIRPRFQSEKGDMS
jgi:PAS domain S-box-containing protein